MIQVKKFYADWCGPCKMLTPIMEQVKGNFSDIDFQNIDIESQYEIAQKYYVRSVPTVIIEKNGEEIHRFAGLQSEMAYTNALNELKN
jgi:thioredoxin 1